MKTTNQKPSNPTTKVWSKFLSQLQRLGKSLMFPIVVLPIAALLLRIGALIEDPLANNSVGINAAQIFVVRLIKTPGGVVFDNLPIIFAIGISFGLAKDNRGEAALVGAVVWYRMNALLRENLLPSAIYGKVLTEGALNNQSQLLYFLKNKQVVYQLDAGVIGGISVGVLVAVLYNRFKEIRLPQALSFFGGRRFVHMLASNLKFEGDKYTVMAQKILAIVQLDNILLVENCATRLRLTF